jgi:S-adenosylmethionine synthetase
MKILTSESVNKGHVDKCCDLIADAFLDAALAQDPKAQMAVECAIKDDLLMIYGEATTTAEVDYTAIANEVLKEVGYPGSFRIMQQISEQSPDINAAVVQGELRANDQGIVYGYACNETPELMPLPIMLAHRLMRKYEEFRQNRTDFFSDAKSQVSIAYDDNDKPVAIATVLISASHSDSLKKEQVRLIIGDEVIAPVLAEYADLLGPDTQIIVNPSGKFTVWGSWADSGCVGRKTQVDAYGTLAKHGGGCFSSKNATKVDRSGAYYARFVAKNIVAAGFADKCEIQVSYGIGLAAPLSVHVETFGTNKKKPAEIEKYVAKNFDFSPANIIKELDLLRPIYKATACYGHFGRDEFPWEQIKTTK